MWGSLDLPLIALILDKGILDKRYFLVIGLIEHLRVLGHSDFHQQPLWL